MTPTTTLPAGLLPGGRFEEWRPRPVRYVVCDVDGTLIGPEEFSTPAVARAIERAQGAGIRVGFATGRMRDGVSGLQQQLGARGPHVLHNGAEVRADGTTVASWTLTPQQVDALLALAHEHEDLYLEVYGESGFHVSAMDERARPHWDLLRAEPLGVVRRAADLDDMPVPKATFAVFTEAALDWLEGRLAHLDAEVGTAGSPRTPGLVFTNVNRPGATKGAAIAAAAEHLAIGTDEVAAIGDAGNDRSMLAVAGTAIAMGQAEPDIIAASHLVTRSVDDDGVATALDALIAWSAPG
jgi:Cof subfamily protein (haloacid dehalogenase superfamily)